MEAGYLNPSFRDWLHALPPASGSGAHWKPLSPENLVGYLEAGRQAYREHYTHLWQHHDPTPYLSAHFTREKMLCDLENTALRHGVLVFEGEAAGIFKLDLGKDSGEFHPGQALFIEKIYLKKNCTGKGFGSALLGHLGQYARSLGRRGLWLEAMARGQARDFYLEQGFRFLGHAEVPYPEVLPEERAMWVLGCDL